MSSHCRGARRALALAAALLAAALLRPSDALALKEGDPFPHFTATDMAGQTIDTKAILAKNKLLLFDFWSIYCSSCLQEMPHVIDIYTRLKGQGLEAVGIDLDVYGQARVKKFMDGLDFKIPWPTVIDAKMEIKGKLGVSMLPTLVIAGADGKVKLFHVGYKRGYEKELEETVKKLLGGK